MGVISEALFWQEADWLEDVCAWIDAQLSKLGATRLGPVTQPHTRPWSTVLQIASTIGPLFFKAAAPTLKHEIAITKTLAEWYPDVSLPILAVELEQGWMLLPDGGERLREVLKRNSDITWWETILARYARLQIDAANRTAELVALGAPDRRLSRLPAEFSRLLEREADLLIDLPDGLTHQQLSDLHNFQPQLAGLCHTLAEMPVPASLNHGDFHDGNIFVQGDRFLLFDWGDCSLSHPFFSLRTVSVSLENTLGVFENTAEFERVLNAYLEPWEIIAPRAQLRQALELSQRLAPLCSALSWEYIVSATSPAQRGAAIYALPSLLSELLELNRDLA